MRDLKHLAYFENLVRESNNALIGQAKDEGKVCVAFVCEKHTRAAYESGRGPSPCACPRRTRVRWTSQRIT